MTARNKNIPVLRFREFTRPLDVTKFGKVVESNLYGPRFNADDYSNQGNVKTIRGTDLGRDGEIKYDQVPLAMLDENTVATHKLLEGDIVMITTADCGSTGVFRKQNVDFLSSAYGVRIRLNKLGYPYYFKYFFQTRFAKKEINSFIRKATVANLPGSDILKIKLFLPSLPEQQKIASFLFAIDEKIRQLTRRKELLEQYKKGVMQQLFSGKLRFKPALSGVEGDENGKAYPKWEEKRLIDIADKSIKWSFTGGPFGSNLKAEDYTKEGVRIIQLQNIGDGVFNNEYKIYTSEEKADELISCNIYPGDILISKMGDPVARACRVPRFDHRYLMASDGIRLVPEASRFDIEFIFHSINCPMFRNKVLSLSTGSTRKRIGLSELKTIELKVPILEEQRKIASLLSSLDTKIESVSAQIARTQEFKKGLLQKMFV